MMSEDVNSVNLHNTDLFTCWLVICGSVTGSFYAVYIVQCTDWYIIYEVVFYVLKVRYICSHST